MISFIRALFTTILFVMTFFIYASELMQLCDQSCIYKGLALLYFGSTSFNHFVVYSSFCGCHYTKIMIHVNHQ